MRERRGFILSLRSSGSSGRADKGQVLIVLLEGRDQIGFSGYMDVNDLSGIAIPIFTLGFLFYRKSHTTIRLKVSN